MFATMAVLIFSFRLFYFSRLQIFGTLIVLTSMEIILFYAYHELFSQPETAGDITSIEEVIKRIQQEELPISVNGFESAEPVTSTAEKINQDFYFKDNPWLFDFIQGFVPLQNIHENRSLVIDTHELSEIFEDRP